MVSRGEEERRRKRGQYLEKENVWRRKIVFFLWRRRRTEKENIENIWRREVVFCGGEEERRKIWRIFGKENSFLWRRRRTKKEREEITRRREGKLMLTSTVDEVNME